MTLVEIIPNLNNSPMNLKKNSKRRKLTIKDYQANFKIAFTEYFQESSFGI